MIYGGNRLTSAGGYGRHYILPAVVGENFLRRTAIIVGHVTGKNQYRIGFDTAEQRTDRPGGSGTFVPVNNSDEAGNLKFLLRGIDTKVAVAEVSDRTAQSGQQGVISRGRKIRF